MMGRTVLAGPSVALWGPPADKDGLPAHLPLGALRLVAAPLLKQGVGVAAQGPRRKAQVPEEVSRAGGDWLAVASCLCPALTSPQQSHRGLISPASPLSTGSCDRPAPRPSLWEVF